jgi:hypothetical protein
MKLFDKRIFKGSMILFINLTLLTVSCILITTNINSKIEIEKLSRGFYSKNALRITISDSQSETLWQKALKENRINNSIIFKNNIKFNMDLRGIYYKGNVELPPIKSGRFFEENECMTNQKIAIIGNSYLNDVEKKDKKQWIRVLKQKFEVIGILGTGKKSRFDSMIFIPIVTALKLQGQEGHFIIDGKHANKILENTQLLKNLLSSSAKVDMERPVGHDITGVGESLNLGTNDIIKTVYLAIFFAFLLTAISSSSYWIFHRNQLIQIQRMLGNKDSKIFIFIVHRYLRVAILSLAFGFVICFNLRQINLLYSIGIIDLVISACCTILIGLVITAVYLFINLCNKNIRMLR